MKLKEFEVETWMTEHELNCQYNLTETSISALSLKELEQITNKDLTSSIKEMVMDYGPITGSLELKQNILSLYKKGSIDNITIAQGSINANELVMMTLLEPNDHVISLYPSYQQLYDFPKSLGCDVSLLLLKEENNWQIELDELEKLINEKTKMICLNSPNNPTGTSFDLAQIEAIVALARKHDLYILCDEVYRGLDYQTKQLAPSFSDYYEKAIVTQSLSKIYSFAGLRLGWIKGPKDLIDLINLRRDYHIISTGPLTDYLGTLVLENKDQILTRSLNIMNNCKKILADWLENEKHLSCVIPKNGPVGFIKYDLPIPSKELCLKIQKETGIFFVPGITFGMEYHFRIGFTHDDQFEKALPILSKWFKQFDEK